MSGKPIPLSVNRQMDKLHQTSSGLAQQLKNALFQRKVASEPVQETKPEPSKLESVDSQKILEEKYTERANQRRIEVKTLKQEIASDKSYVNTVIKNKLAEYGVAENTPINLSRDKFGRLEIEAAILPSQSEAITSDLNKDKHFVDAFLRLTKTQPALNYVDNVVKLNEAYGSRNTVFDSLLSEKKEFNQLKDISLRYESLRSAQGNLESSNTNLKITVA